MSDAAPRPASGGLDRLYGAVVTSATAEFVTAEMPITEALQGAAGVGALSAIGESAAVAGTELGVRGAASASIRVISAVTSSLRPLTGGTLYARAVRRHAGRTTWVWEVELADNEGRSCGVTRVTVAVVVRDG